MAPGSLCLLFVFGISRSASDIRFCPALAVVGDAAELDVSTPEIVIARAILLWLSGNGTEARSILSALTRDSLDPAIRIQSEEILAEMDASSHLIPASPGESEVGSADPAIPH